MGFSISRLFLPLRYIGPLNLWRATARFLCSWPCRRQRLPWTGRRP